MSAGGPRLAPDGRDPVQVPENWTELLDPAEWRLNEEGLPARRAARVVALRESPHPEILLVVGHDFADAGHWWAFTPGGGILDGEDARSGARRELAEETGIVLDDADLTGPVARRSSRFRFNLVTCRQEEEIFLARPGTTGPIDRAGWTDLEKQVLDSLRWWGLDELDAAVEAGMTVYPHTLPRLARELLAGWDGVTRRIIEDD
ncbi:MULTISPECIES: NUDIX domain-containing protein [unclassified Actinomyces]|uniref:NUDIX hydrolase n=1 Tax=unclassified Actinomyces TaxID=2609248 RepID=UPI002017E9A9|nr:MULTISPECIES: NUDIX domain-containing protein [unclassified Actinomyces]MCL3778351.1 NUDIX domain-containing protein [Actinomyces sp. AC-20-1]MCL3790202.1 NUDIX domain-containing protein [Actinomyces sp. 187325]MCL3792487.1 NUDIX domain-containing protein [Actinomyces sp. 186855]MCL3794323.1 NUDIX domain-containing protein [Actinomyces sp. 217892]